MMINLRKLFRRPSVEEGCLLTTRLLLEGLTVDQIYRRLRSDGFSDRKASRCVTFLPSAFARIYYEDKGYSFPDFYYPGMSAYKKGKFERYSGEPIFLTAMQLAQQMRRDEDWNQVEKIVEISAEHRGIVEAKARGLTPTGSSIIIYEF